jgi:hypothetical protein
MSTQAFAMEASDAHEALAAFKRYTQAFQSLDPKAPGPCFHEPALMVSPDGVNVLRSAADVERAYRGVMARLPAMGYAKTTFLDLKAQRLSADLAVINGSGIWENAQGKTLSRFGMTYTFRLDAGAWKILTALIYDA